MLDPQNIRVIKFNVSQSFRSFLILELLSLSTHSIELSRLAAAGQGFDRHLFAMKCLAKSLDMSTPTIFEDPTYSFANHFILSTSHLYADNVCSGGYGPVVPDGFGLAYGIDSSTSYTLIKI